jgi:hypothetical protein
MEITTERASNYNDLDKMSISEILSNINRETSRSLRRENAKRW